MEAQFFFFIGVLAIGFGGSIAIVSALQIASTPSKKETWGNDGLIIGGVVVLVGIVVVVTAATLL